MDIFFTEPTDIPVPPEEVRIQEFEALPRPDGKRVNIRLAVTPFLQRPNMEVNIINREGQIVANLGVVEATEAKMTFTMHLREGRPQGLYRATVRVFYSNLDEHSPENGEENSPGEILRQVTNTVDTSELTFEIHSETN